MWNTNADGLIGLIHCAKWWDVARSYASIVGSHHGKPPIERKLGELEKSKDIAPKRLGSCDEKWIQVQRELIEYVTDIAGIDAQSLARMGTTRLSPQSEVLLTAIQSWLIGLPAIARIPYFRSLESELTMMAIVPRS